VVKANRDSINDLAVELEALIAIIANSFHKR